MTLRDFLASIGDWLREPLWSLRLPAWLRQTRWPGRLLSFPVLGLNAGLVLAMVAGVRAVGAGLIFHKEAWSALAVLTGIYLCGGLAAGVVIALLYPLARWIAGAFVLGAAAGVPMFFMIGRLFVADESPRETVLTSVLLATLMGGPLATAVWFEHRGRNLPRWVAMLRFPTWGTVGRVWAVAVVCAVVAWYIGLRWSGQWPAIVAVFLLLGPAVLATLVTIMATRQSDNSANQPDLMK